MLVKRRICTAPCWSAASKNIGHGVGCRAQPSLKLHVHSACRPAGSQTLGSLVGFRPDPGCIPAAGSGSPLNQCNSVGQVDEPAIHRNLANLPNRR